MPQELRIDAPVILASASPRRKELINLAFSHVTVCPADIDESRDPALRPEEVSAAIARKKAEYVAGLHPDKPVIGCDTVVISEDRILTKPADEQDAFAILRALSGKTHLVSTGCALVYKDQIRCFSEETRVTFHPLSDEIIRAYIRTGEPMDKAGAYGIQGRGSLLVKGIEGDYFNVVGLPVSRLYREFLDLVNPC